MKFPHFLPPYSRSKAPDARAKTAVVGAHASVRRGYAEARARGHLNHDAGLVAIFGRRRAVDHFERLDRVHGNLVREDFALLIGDGLAVDGERVFGVVAEAVEEAVRIGGDAGRSLRNERAHGRRRTFQRHLIEKLAVDVGVRRRVGFDQVGAGGDGDRGGGSGQLSGPL